MRRIKLSVLVFLCLGLMQVSAQEQLPKQISVKPPVVVNFKAAAGLELLNPPKRKRRVVEQGEDKERRFKFRPSPVPEGTAVYNVPAPVRGQGQGNEKALVSSPVASATFNGVLDNGTLIPPDIRGCAGPNYVIETTNQQFNIYTKTVKF